MPHPKDPVTLAGDTLPNELESYFAFDDEPLLQRDLGAARQGTLRLSPSGQQPGLGADRPRFPRGLAASTLDQVRAHPAAALGLAVLAGLWLGRMLQR